jgi:hypothetical protein
MRSGKFVSKKFPEYDAEGETNSDASVNTISGRTGTETAAPKRSGLSALGRIKTDTRPTMPATMGIARPRIRGPARVGE